MTKKDLIALVTANANANGRNISSVDTEAVVNALIEELRNTLCKGDEITIPAARVAKFQSAKALKEALNQG